MRYYTEGIRQAQKELGLEVDRFPNLELYDTHEDVGDQMVTDDIEEEAPYIFESNIRHNTISMENMCVYRSFILPIIDIECGLIFSIIIISAIVIHSYAVSAMPTRNTTTALLPNFRFAAAGDWACNSNTISTKNRTLKTFGNGGCNGSSS